MLTYPRILGYPLGHVPLGKLRYNGRPFGLCLMARADGEETLLRFISSYEAAVPPRPVPNLSRFISGIKRLTRKQ